MSTIILPADIKLEQGENTGGKQGYIYLIHFEEKMHHAQHYIGWAKDVDKRLDIHENCEFKSAKIVKAFLEKGIQGTVVRLWEGDGNFERKLKNRKKTRCLCPVCIQKN